MSYCACLAGAGDEDERVFLGWMFGNEFFDVDLTYEDWACSEWLRLGKHLDSERAAGTYICVTFSYFPDTLSATVAVDLDPTYPQYRNMI